MGKGSLKDKQHRHSLILSLLRNEDFWTTELLCKNLSIGPRTLMRDLSELRELGHPIESERGRGGGISLKGRWGLTKLLLNNEEIISMLVSLAIVDAIGTPLFGENLKSIRKRISDSFPFEQKELIKNLRKRIFIGKSASRDILNSYSPPKSSILNNMSRSFFLQKIISISYKDAKGIITERTIEPKILLLNWPIWYFLCWDKSKNDSRLFRIDRIEKVKILNYNFKINNMKNMMKDFEDYFEQL